jgi:hypothetical protein
MRAAAVALLGTGKWLTILYGLRITTKVLPGASVYTLHCVILYFPINWLTLFVSYEIQVQEYEKKIPVCFKKYTKHIRVNEHCGQNV